MSLMDDETRNLDMLERAVALSHEHMHAGHGGPFGAVIARADGTLVAEGWNEVLSSNDPTAHAEVVAIRRACAKLGTFELSGHVLYSSCEPCPMCLSAIHWARLDAVIFANSRHDAADIGFDDALIYEEVSKPLEGRIMRCEHVPLDSARAVFEAWRHKADKVPY